MHPPSVVRPALSLQTATASGRGPKVTLHSHLSCCSSSSSPNDAPSIRTAPRWTSPSPALSPPVREVTSLLARPAPSTRPTARPALSLPRGYFHLSRQKLPALSHPCEVNNVAPSTRASTCTLTPATGALQPARLLLPSHSHSGARSAAVEPSFGAAGAGASSSACQWSSPSRSPR